jgi:hypothetical protein
MSLATLVIALSCVGTHTAFADVITDWDEKAVAFVTPRMPPPATGRVMAMVHIAMFDAVNSIERRYHPYLIQLPAATMTSKEASAATAAATVLAGLHPDAAADLRDALASYLATIAEGHAKSDGIKLGEGVAAKILEARSGDGSGAPDTYRPKTSLGVYVPTAITVLSMWPGVKPFAMASPSHFRPEAPISLTSERWVADYNEIKDFGAKTSVRRSPRQTEDARFWLITGAQSIHPLARQLAVAKKMSVIDSARFMTLVAIAEADMYIAVLDAKYHYDFWRPVTAIRNGDLHGTSAIVRDAAWQPLDSTPMHPEYPCAHCVGSATFAAVVEAVLGSADVPELVMTSPTAQGVTHRWTNVWALAKEVSESRIWAGFHYRFSTKVGQDMGGKIGRYVVQNVMQPLNQARGSR